MRAPVTGRAERVQLHVRSLGSGDPVLFLHGFGASSFTWRAWVPELARRHRVLLLDMKGFGSSPKPRDGCYTPSDLADGVHDFIRERDLRRLAIVGHSLGGGVALLVALRLLDDGEDRLERLVAVGGVAYRQTIPFYVDVLRRLPRAGFLFGLLPAPWLIRRVLESIFHDPSQVTTEQVEGYSRPLTTPDARDALVTCARQLLPPDLDEIVARFPEIDVPALLLWGRQDRVVPLSVAKRLAGELPRARLAVLEDCGHVPPEEKPEESLRIVAAFLAEARRDSGTSPHAGTGG